MEKFILSNIRPEYCTALYEGFKILGYAKPEGLFERYCDMQISGERDVIVALSGNEIAGYLTVAWQSDYPDFRKQQIPEVIDFNVFKKNRRHGCGTLLMDEAEQRIKARSPYAGIGVGLYKDYGPAQVLYARRGYIPDGKGITRDGNSILPGTTEYVDDGLIMMLTKRL